MITDLRALGPAVAFLCTAVPLAALLGRLGFFDALADRVVERRDHIPLVWLWVLAAAVTALLNLDTSIVLLTPLYVGLAQRSATDPLEVATIPLVLAAFASSVLPVSNLTTLVVAERLALSNRDVATHLGPASAVAVVVGWWAFRRRCPSRSLQVQVAPAGSDPMALRTGGVVVAVVVVGFVAGPALGIAAWQVALAADVVLVLVTGTVPWRSIPLATAAAVLVVGALVRLAPPSAFRALFARDDVVVAALAGSVAANAVNNLPAALLLASHAPARPTPSTWAWLLSVNVSAALVPIGALANVLWLRIVRSGLGPISISAYVRRVVPVVAPAAIAAVATLAVTERLHR